MTPRRDSSEKCNDKNAVANVNASFVLKKGPHILEIFVLSLDFKRIPSFKFLLKKLNIVVYSLFFLLLFVPSVSKRNQNYFDKRL